MYRGTTFTMDEKTFALALASNLQGILQSAGKIVTDDTNSKVRQAIQEIIEARDLLVDAFKEL